MAGADFGIWIDCGEGPTDRGRQLVLFLVLTLLLTAHLLCVNCASAGPLVCIWFEWREGKSDPLAGQVGRWLAWMSVLTLLAGVLLGLLLGYCEWEQGLAPTLHVLDAEAKRITFGVMEIVFSLLIMIGHAVWWHRGQAVASRLVRGTRIFLLLLAGTNLLYHFPLLFNIVSTLRITAADSAPLTRSEFRVFLLNPEVLSKSVHFILASFAVVGTTLLAYSWRLQNASAPDEDSLRVARWGARLALIPTLGQLPVGMWVAVSLNTSQRSLMMGGEGVASLLFILSIVLAFGLMHHLSDAAREPQKTSLLVRSIVLMVLVVACMTAATQRAKMVSINERAASEESQSE